MEKIKKNIKMYINKYKLNKKKQLKKLTHNYNKNLYYIT